MYSWDWDGEKQLEYTGMLVEEKGVAAVEDVNRFAIPVQVYSVSC